MLNARLVSSNGVHELRQQIIGGTSTMTASAGPNNGRSAIQQGFCQAIQFLFAGGPIRHQGG